MTRTRRVVIEGLNDDTAETLFEEDVDRVHGGGRLLFNYHHFSNTALATMIGAAGRHEISGAMVKVN